MPSPSSSPAMLPLTLVSEGERIMRICNACRYCEGYCATFPALERRLAFGEHDLSYLANLCHDCGDCFDACQYAPPHEFHVDVPRTLSRIRVESYRRYTWPSLLGGVFTRPWMVLAAAGLVSPLGFFAGVGLVAGRHMMFSAHGDASGAFYEVVPHPLMIGFFSIVGVAAFAVLATPFVRFWNDTGRRFGLRIDAQAMARGLADAASLRYLGGGGEGCSTPGGEPSQVRRWLHHTTFYGFLFCGAATTVAAVYHHLYGLHAPYPLTSAPVMLGCVGGVGLIIGPAGLLAMAATPTRRPTDPVGKGLGPAFLVMLLMTSMTGFLLLLTRSSSAMGTMLAIHLGVVFGLFVTMPYGKFVHAGYRVVALLVNAAEARTRGGAEQQ